MKKIRKLIPECKDYLWGGTRLVTEYGKKTDKTPCAESWELSFHPDGPTRVEGGQLLSDALTKEDLGTNCASFDFFPTLIKFIDAKQNLSVQVHPDDAYALKNEHSLGKTEMWYIVDATPEAGIYLGFKGAFDRKTVEKAIAEKTLTDYLQFVPVKKGDCFFIPAGTVHAICAGCLICEIQQNSNITYRVYDYGRRDKNGNERQLHVAKALDVMTVRPADYPVAPLPVPGGEVLASCPFFTTRRYSVGSALSLYADETSFLSVTCLSGAADISGASVAKGDTVFIPAGFGDVLVSGSCDLIVVNV